MYVPQVYDQSDSYLGLWLEVLGKVCVHMCLLWTHQPWGLFRPEARDDHCTVIWKESTRNWQQHRGKESQEMESGTLLLTTFDARVQLCLKSEVNLDVCQLWQWWTPFYSQSRLADAAVACSFSGLAITPPPSDLSSKWIGEYLSWLVTKFCNRGNPLIQELTARDRLSF